MAKALVLYESFFGNTERVARWVGGILDARVLKVDSVNIGDLGDLELLVVGSPTRAFGPTKNTKAFLNALPRNALDGVRVAAFDTRLDPVRVGSGVYKLFARLFGFAAEKIAKALTKRGGKPVVEPGAFVVEESEGPLVEGEPERAEAWAAGILDRCDFYN